MSLNIIDGTKKRGSVMCTCENCGVEFKKEKSQFDKSNRHFCSPDCRYKGQITRVKCTCDTCGIEFEKKKSQFENSDRHFCSRECKGMRVKCTCAACGVEFEKKKNQFDKSDRHFCSRECRGMSVKCTCDACGVEFEMKKSRFEAYDRHFCSKKCSLENPASSPRSKFEIALEEIIRNSYPNEEIITNDRRVLNGYEIDLYFPRIKLGIEINGIRHYKDIHGDGSLAGVKRRDKIKRDRARRRGINIRTINISGSKSNITGKTGKKVLEEAVGVIKSFL